MKKVNIGSWLSLKLKPIKFKEVFKAAGDIVALVLAGAIMFISCYDKIFAIREKPDANTPIFGGATKDELDSGADELPEEYRDIIYEREYPLGLGIYDTLFGTSTPPAPDGELKIVSTDLSQNPTPENIKLKNNSTKSIKASDFLTVLGQEIKEVEIGDEPLVLIYHTHGTEGFAAEGKTSYSPSSLPRPRDITKNVVAVGKALADYLNAQGIPTLHCTVMHDDGSYNTAYKNSANMLKEYLKKYPSIKYTFDIHRDALLNDTTLYKTLTYDESTPVAQIMFVVGTNSSGAKHDHWERSLSFAVNAQYFLASRLNNIVRPISVKKSSYNQQYAYIGALIEVGTVGNTLKEALNSVEILGQTLAFMIKSDIKYKE